MPDADFQGARRHFGSLIDEMNEEAEREHPKVTTIHREPTAALELTEAELEVLLGVEPANRRHAAKLIAAEASLHRKAQQALRVERGCGGFFDGRGGAA